MPIALQINQRDIDQASAAAQRQHISSTAFATLYYMQSQKFCRVNVNKNVSQATAEQLANLLAFGLKYGR